MQSPTECDVLVIGSGAAGLAAAVTASVSGLEVIVTDHADCIGGTTAISGGEVWIPMSRQAQGQGDSREAALAYLEQVAGDSLDRPRAQVYLERAAEALAFLEDHSHLEYELLPHVVDYFSEFTGATAGLRSLGALPFDGRRLGGHFAQVRPPLATSMIFGGMSLGREDLTHFTRFTRSGRSAVYVLGVLTRHLRDRLAGQRRGTRMVMGNALVGRLALTLLDRNVPIWLETRATALCSRDGRITGAVVRRSMKPETIHARRAVIVATGSFSGSARMQSRFFNHVGAGIAHHTHLPDTNDGSGIDLVLACGGVLDDRPSQAGAWTPVSEVPMPNGSKALMPHFGDRAKPGVIVVNKEGRRFANEARTYHEFVQAMLKTSAGRQSAECYVMTSRMHLRKYGLGRVPAFPGRSGPFIRSGYLLEGRTLRELAARLGVDADQLEQTVGEFDRHAASGVDPFFLKGETSYERVAGDAEVRPNPCVAPLGKGPYYAIRIVPGDIGTLLGVKVDVCARALSASGQPISGLYAVGTVASSMMGGTYPGAGSMLGPSITFGYIAARNAASIQREALSAAPSGASDRDSRACMPSNGANVA